MWWLQAAIGFSRGGNDLWNRYLRARGLGVMGCGLNNGSGVGILTALDNGGGGRNLLCSAISVKWGNQSPDMISSRVGSGEVVPRLLNYSPLCSSTARLQLFELRSSSNSLRVEGLEQSWVTRRPFVKGL